MNIPVLIYKALASQIFPTVLITYCLKEFLNAIFKRYLKRLKLFLFLNLVTQIRLRIIDLFSCSGNRSKTCEKLMCDRLDSYLKPNNIYVQISLHGFRKNSNASDAIVEFRDHVNSSLDKKQSNIAVYLDFSKAFDTVNHDILMSKFQHNGIRGVMQSWFKSHLSNRKQCLRQKLQLFSVKHYTSCSARPSDGKNVYLVGPSTFSFVHQ